MVKKDVTKLSKANKNPCRVWPRLDALDCNKGNRYKDYRNILKREFHNSAHVHESKYCFSPVHAEAGMQAR